MNRASVLALASLLGCLCPTSHAASAVILGWNNLGMHCMDSDYSVFTVLPRPTTPSRPSSSSVER